jgi:hypothetical protein
MPKKQRSPRKPHVAKRRKSISPIFENAIDSLRIGMEFFQRDSSYSTHKHAILTVFHAIELLLKEQLHRTNPVLIYKNIDKTVTDDSVTVGVVDAITRLENTGVKLPDDQRAIVEKIQSRRNRIEHHRYDHKEAEDAIIIAEALKVIFYFAEFVLEVRLEDHIDHTLLLPMKQRVMEYNELQGLAEFRFEAWAKTRWPKWDNTVEDIPAEFEGTHDCPECRQTWLVIGYHPKPFCFWCNVPVDAAICENCGRTYFVKDGCCSPETEDFSFGS